MKYLVEQTKDLKFERKYVAKVFGLNSDRFLISIANPEYVGLIMNIVGKRKRYVIVDTFGEENNRYLIPLDEFAEKLNIVEKIEVVGLDSYETWFKKVYFVTVTVRECKK